ncbi:ribonuclease T2 family protein [Cohaesibacter intestini]|uniref:ribonuclease T2 family protein n=1 Tax=Cohaesibacter intestini TaxID=2211145 RepID=UPI001300763A|nr:ribonuclease T2 [Cohaesibacter intestini]
MAIHTKLVALLTTLMLFPLAFDKAQADRAGDFDYYLLALSWSPSYCADDGRQGRDKLQCFSGRPYGFVIHGLWPQHESGYPEFCRSSHRKPSDKLVDQMLKYSPSRGLIHHEWKKHGSCTGLSPLDYFRKAVKSYKSLKRPSQLVGLERPLLMTVKQIRDAFLNANPDLPRDSVLVTCKRNKLREVRICFDKQGSPRACSPSAFKGACRDRGKLRILAVR